MSFRLRCGDREDYARIRDVFDRAEYTDQSLVAIFGAAMLPTRAARDLPMFLYRTRGGTPLDTLIRLFLLGVPVELEAACRAVEPVPLDIFRSAGLVFVDAGLVRATVRLLPYGGLLVPSDQFQRFDEGRPEDLVSPITASSVALAHFTVRRPVSRTLDLGTGGGLQAFLAAAHSEEVYGTDVNPRALNYAAFGAGLNGVFNLRILEGSAFGPVRGRQFDLIVSNPPFAVTPSRRFAYRDSGQEGDSFCRDLVREGARHLAEGGFLQILGDWIQPAGEDWEARLAAWFEGTHCDAWVLRTDTRSPAEYADAWIRETEHGISEGEAVRLHEEWTGYYEREGIEAIGSGLIALRRSGRARNWIRIADAPDKTSGDFGEYVVLGFALRDFLEDEGSDEALLDQNLRVAPGIRLNQSCSWAEGRWRGEGAQVWLHHGLQYTGNIDPHVAALVAACDGRRPLRELIIELAGSIGVPAERLAPNCLALVRQFLDRGFLLPPGLRAPSERRS